jgi:cytoskeleton protein RodZ
VENVVGDETPNNEDLRFKTVGEQLKTERLRQGLTLTDVATRTRVPMRHLESIENSQFSNLPGSTYTLGFTRSYARILDLDAAKLGNELRTELAQGGHDSYHIPAQNYEPADASRVPSRTLAWTAAAVGALVLAGYLLWRAMMLDGDAAPVATVSQTPKPVALASAQGVASATPVSGDVVLTATDTVWVKIYDASNNRLFESEMKAGDTYSVPKDANKPMIVTGRPQSLNVTVGGKAVPPLGKADTTIANIDISAAGLAARPVDTSTMPTTTNP